MEHEWCFVMNNQRPNLLSKMHEILNCVACVMLIIFISFNSVLRNAYKFDLLPVLLITVVHQFSYVCYASIPALACYFITKADRPWNMQISRFLMNTSFCLKQVFILHSLIRIALNLRYSSIGVIKSIILPAILFAILIVEENTADSYWLLSWASKYLSTAAALINLGISIFLIRKSQTGGFSFPIIMLMYEILHCIADILKLSLYVASYNNHDYAYTQAYFFVEENDEYANYVTAVFTLVILVWDNRKLSALSRIDGKAIDNPAYSY